MAAQGIPDEDHGVDLPMTMTASVILTGLPTDAKKVLEKEVEGLDGGKGVYYFH
jgi:ubiquitin-like protein ATG12